MKKPPPKETLEEMMASLVPKQEVTAWLEERDEPIPTTPSEWLEADDRREFEQFCNRENKRKGGPFTEEGLRARCEKERKAQIFLSESMEQGPSDPGWEKAEGWPSLDAAVSLSETIFWKVQKLPEDFEGKWDLQLDAASARQKIRWRLYPSTFTEDFVEGLSAGWELARAAFVAEMGERVLQTLRANCKGGRKPSEGAELDDLKEWLKDLWNGDAERPGGVPFLRWLLKHGEEHQIVWETPDQRKIRNPNTMQRDQLNKVSFSLKDGCGKAYTGDTIRRWVSDWRKEKETGLHSV